MEISRQIEGWGGIIHTPLNYLKEVDPFITDEYVVANKIDMEPSFAWCTPDTLRRRDQITPKFNARYCKRTHKFGIQMPKTIN